MKFRYDLAVAIIDELLADTSLMNKANGVYLVSADDDATPPYLVYEQITDGTKIYTMNTSEATVSMPQIRIKIWDADSPAAGTSEEVMDLVDDVMDFKRIEREGLSFKPKNTGSMTRDYENESGFQRSWLQYRMDIV